MKAYCNKFYYQVYGLNIKSSIEIEGLITLGDKLRDRIDAIIEIGKVSKEIKDEALTGKKEGYSSNSMWFKRDEVGIFHILNGNKIIIELRDEYDSEMFKVYLLGIGFALLMIQRGQLSFQGGAVNLNEKGVLIIGKSGVGKSTLLNGLKCKGYKLLADDMTSLNKYEDGRILINPSFPIQRISTDVIEKLEGNKERYNRVNLNRELCLVSMDKKFSNTRVPLFVILQLSVEDINEISIKEVRGYEKVKLLMENIFRGVVLNHIEIDPNYFKECIVLAKNVSVYKLIRPQNGFTINKQIQIIEELILKDYEVSSVAES